MMKNSPLPTEKGFMNSTSILLSYFLILFRIFLKKNVQNYYQKKWKFNN